MACGVPLCTACALKVPHMPCWYLCSLSWDKRIAYKFPTLCVRCHVTWPNLGACRQGSCLQSIDLPSGLAHYSKRTPMLLYETAEDRHAGKVNPAICYTRWVLAARLFPLRLTENDACGCALQ